MPNKYFKPHKPYDRNPNKYDIGVFVGLKKGYEDDLFIKKLFTLPGIEYATYYLYHLTYFLGKEPNGEQEFFFPLYGRSFCGVSRLLKPKTLLLSLSNILIRWNGSILPKRN